MNASSPRGARPRLAPAIEAAILGLGLASSAGVALAGGCAASHDAARAEPSAAAMLLSEELGRRYRWQPGVCRYDEPAEAEAPQPEHSSRAAALALEQIRAGTGH
jgi:hypothetical protein